MIDISDVVMEAFTAPGCDGGEDVAGFSVVPASDTRKIVIPSPPTTRFLPINPRICVFYILEEVITADSEKAEALKAYAKENKLVVLVVDKKEVDDYYSLYQWSLEQSGKLNIKKDTVAVVAGEACVELVDKVMEMLENEEANVVEVDAPAL